jgi:hypothetical protein
MLFKGLSVGLFRVDIWYSGMLLSSRGTRGKNSLRMREVNTIDDI